MSVVLRPYQDRAVQALRSHIRAGRRRLLLVAPTGAGKTVIASYVMARAHERGSRVLFLAHRRELIQQTWRKLVDAGSPTSAMGVIMAKDRRSNPTAPIQVASVDTLRHRERPPVDLLIIDEAHRSLARTYLDLASHYAEQGATVLGLTATPYRADGGGLGEVYDVLEVVATPRQLIDDGFIVEPRVFSGGRIDLSGVRIRRGDYVERDLAEAMNTTKLVGNIVDHWSRHAAGMRTVAFAVTVEHSRQIAERFVAAGVPAEHLDGETPMAERDAILARLQAGETLVVSNCGVLCEGWDQPAVKCAILARPTKSTGLYLQQAGRILRPWKDQRAIILDHAGNALMHGLPQDDRVFSLDPAKKNYESEPLKVCQECGAVVSSGRRICPECGSKFGGGEGETFVGVESDDELIEIHPIPDHELTAAWDELVFRWRQLNDRRASAGRDPMKPGWVWHQFRERFHRRPPTGCRLPAEIATPERKREALSEMIATARERGYRPGWAVHRFRERFGHGPEEIRS